MSQPRIARLLFLAASAALLFAGCSDFVSHPAAPTQPATAAPFKLVVHETVLATLPPADQKCWHVVSPDARRVAYSLHREGKQVVYLDGAGGNEYGDVEFMFFTQDSKHLVCLAKRLDGKVCYIIDGRESRAYQSLGGSYHYDSASGRLLLTAKRLEDGQDLVVMGDTEFVEGLWEGPAIFSPDGKRVALARAGGKPPALTPEGRAAGLQIDDVFPGYALNACCDNFCRFSPDSKRLACVQSGPQGPYVAVDGVAGKNYESIEPPQFSPDSKHCWYTAVRDKQWHLVLDGREIAARPLPLASSRISWEGISYSPDGRRMARFDMEGDKQRLVVDGVAGPLYDWIDHPTFSPDSRHLAYAACKKEGDFIVVDGHEHKGRMPGPDSSLVFSPDSKHLAYLGLPPRATPSPADGAADTSTGIFGDKPVRLDWFVVVDGIRGKSYECALSVDFTPDSRHVIAQAMRDEKWATFVDGVAVPGANDGISETGIHYEGPSRFFAAVQRDRDIIRLDVEIVEEKP
jgi:hypothetical protein